MDLLLRPRVRGCPAAAIDGPCGSKAAGVLRDVARMPTTTTTTETTTRKTASRGAGRRVPSSSVSAARAWPDHRRYDSAPARATFDTGLGRVPAAVSFSVMPRRHTRTHDTRPPLSVRPQSGTRRGSQGTPRRLAAAGRHADGWRRRRRICAHRAPFRRRPRTASPPHSRAQLHSRRLSAHSRVIVDCFK